MSVVSDAGLLMDFAYIVAEVTFDIPGLVEAAARSAP